MDQRLAIGGGILAVSLIVSVGLISYRLGSTSSSKSPDIYLEVKPQPKAPSALQPTATAAAAVSAKPSAVAVPAKPLTIDDAILAANFGDSVNGAPHPSAIDFLPWAMNNLVWEDLKGPKVPHTEIARVLRDADRERGRRICLTGTVGQILGEDVPGGRVYSGGMGGAAGVIRFIAVGAADNVYDGESAQFCGVVVGREAFVNASGGTTHSVRAVGMFDVPANRKRVRATTAP